MNKNKLKKALDDVLRVVDAARCEELSHPLTRYQHWSGENCKIKLHLDKQAQVIRKWMKEEGILD